jgi:D-amino-acid dehydrogenase
MRGLRGLMRVVVVGAGVVGLSTGYFLRKAGADVTVLTLGEPGEGASAVNAGWIAPSLSGPVPGPGILSGSLRWMLRPDSPFYVRPRIDPGFLRWLLEFRARCNPRDHAIGLDAIAALNRRTLQLYDQLRADGLEFDEHRTGLVMAYRTAREADHEAAASAWFGRFGFPPPVPGRPRDLEPALGDSIGGAYLLPADRHVDPGALTAALTAAIGRLGGAVVPATRALSVEPGRRAGGDGGAASGATVIGETRRWPADAVVVAAGAWTPTLLRDAHVRIPIIGGKGYALDFEPAPIALRQALYLHDDRVAGSPYDGRLRLSGTMELTGLDVSISRRRVAAIARAAARALPAWPADAAPARVSAGLRPLTPDGLPVIGPVERAPGVWIASGHSMLGVTLGPSTGEALASAILGTLPDVLRPFRPGRFS